MVVLAQIKLLFCYFVFLFLHVFFSYRLYFFIYYLFFFFSPWELVQLEWMDFM